MSACWRIALIVLVQTVALGAILADRALILANGREIVLETEPVDPRDLLRGDYVILNYAASRFDVATVAGDNTFSDREIVWVIFAGQDTRWQPTAVYHAKPDASALGADEVLVKAVVVNHYSTSADGTADECPEGCEMVILSYGVESYFVPEGTGPVLEDARNEKRLEVVVAVRADGRAAIKALRFDGRTFATEGLL